MFDEKTCSLMAPTVSGSPLPLAFARIYKAESRIEEVAVVNAHKAPELLACFNMAFLELKEHLVKLQLLKVDALKAANKRRSVVILDEVPRILREKGISSSRSPGGSEDQRQAILDQDEEYLKAKDRVDLLEAMEELLEGKVEGMEWAFTSVKKVLGNDNPWHHGSGLSKDRNLSAPSELPEGLQPGVTIDPNSTRAKFGGSK